MRPRCRCDRCRGTVPGGGGDNIVVDSIGFGSKELKIKLENLGSNDVVLTDVVVSWPVATNGGLVEIKNGGDSIFKPSNAVSASPLTVASGDWTADAKKRTIKHGDTREFKFKFQNDVIQSLSNYTVTFAFDNGTTVDVGP